MRIFAGILKREGVKRQWGNRKRRFSEILDATSSAPQEKRPTLLYSITYSLVAFPLTPKYMTLNDLDGQTDRRTSRSYLIQEQDLHSRAAADAL